MRELLSLNASFFRNFYFILEQLMKPELLFIQLNVWLYLLPNTILVFFCSLYQEGIV